MNKTNIEYLDYSWNPFAMRCTPCSPGCLNCWHLQMAKRLAKNPFLTGKQKDAYNGFMTKPYLVRKKLDEPGRVKKPSREGVQFMGDLFHESINIRGDEIRWIFREMSKWDHTFILLTKRPIRMAECIDYLYGGDFAEIMPHVWVGATVCNQPEGGGVSKKDACFGKRNGPERINRSGPW